MTFTLDENSGVPIYLQIVEQVRRRIATGALRPGDQLPSVRETALRLRINPNTVARAFGELEREGVVETRQGSGTFVAEGVSPLRLAEKRRLVQEACDRAVVEGLLLGWQPEDLKKLFADRVDRHAREEGIA